MIYLAGPYWHTDPAVRARRVTELCTFHGNLLCKRVPGAFYYNPLVNSQGTEIAHLPETYWWNHGLHMLQRSSALYVLQSEGWDKSTGVNLERAFATNNGIPVTYFPSFWGQPNASDK